MMAFGSQSESTINNSGLLCLQRSHPASLSHLLFQSQPVPVQPLPFPFSSSSPPPTPLSCLNLPLVIQSPASISADGPITPARLTKIGSTLYPQGLRLGDRWLHPDLESLQEGYPWQIPTRRDLLSQVRGTIFLASQLKSLILLVGSVHLSAALKPLTWRYLWLLFQLAIFTLMGLQWGNLSLYPASCMMPNDSGLSADYLFLNEIFL